jgi:hypothetical protein
MYHLLEEDLARSKHVERTMSLEREHRHQLTRGLRDQRLVWTTMLHR